MTTSKNSVDQERMLAGPCWLTYGWPHNGGIDWTAEDWNILVRKSNGATFRMLAHEVLSRRGK